MYLATHVQQTARARQFAQRTVFEPADHPYLQCWTLFFVMVMIIVIEVSVIIYSETVPHGSLKPIEIPYEGDPVADIRSNLGLDVGNTTSPGSIAFLKPNDNVSLELFTEQYSEMCETYFMPRGINSETYFRGLFQQITRRNLTDKQIALLKRNAQHTFSDNDAIVDSKGSIVQRTNDDNTDGTAGTSIPLCSCVPDELIGAMNISLDVPHLGELELAYPEIKDGGHWTPRDCLARHRTAIIIPFRDREEHLQILINYLHPFLQRQLLYYTIFVVEQVYPEVFNKASIMNVGYKEATLADSFDCFIFHDVDMIPENDYNFYTCTPKPRHVGSHCDKFQYEVAYANVFGGVTAFTSEQFMTANGFSNDFYGWGGEDDDMYNRVRTSNMSISRYPGSISRYTMIKHGSDARNPYNKRATVGFKPRPNHYKLSGLNSLRYYVRRREYRPLYTWMLVELPDRILTLLTDEGQVRQVLNGTGNRVTCNWLQISVLIALLMLIC